MKNGILFHFWISKKAFTKFNTATPFVKQVVTPKSLQGIILKEYHDDFIGAHFGFTRTMARIKNDFWWPGMFRDVKHWINSCSSCASKKIPRGKPYGLLQPMVAAEPFEMIAIDLFGPITESKRGNKYIVVISDYLTRYVITEAIPADTTEEVIKVLVEKVFTIHGPPSKLLSDRGGQFLSKIAQQIYKLLEIKKVNTTHYRPQTDGLVERFNQTMAAMISMYINSDHDNWDQLLPWLTYAYNTSVQESLKYSPFYLLFGRDPKSFLWHNLEIEADDLFSSEEWAKELLQRLNEARKFSTENLKLAQEHQKKLYDETRTEFPFTVGSKVWIYNWRKPKDGETAKFLHYWDGPYILDEELHPNVWIVKTIDGRKLPDVVNVQNIKKYVSPESRPEISSLYITPIQVDTDELIKVYDSPSNSETESIAKTTDRLKNQTYLPNLVWKNNLIDFLMELKESRKINIRNCKNRLQTVVGYESSWLRGEERKRFGNQIKELSTKEEFLDFTQRCIDAFDTLKMRS